MEDKFVSLELLPEGLDRELLIVLAEECCEIGQRVSKALRFGLREVEPGQSLDNAQRISQEVGDLIEVVSRLQNRGILEAKEIELATRAKSKKLDRYLQFS